VLPDDHQGISPYRALADKSSAMTPVLGDAQLKELVQLVHNQTQLVEKLQTRSDSLERSNALLVDRILNQSLATNHLLMQVDSLNRQQQKLSTELAELKQREPSSQEEGYRFRSIWAYDAHSGECNLQKQGNLNCKGISGKTESDPNLDPNSDPNRDTNPSNAEFTEADNAPISM
jgi:hypothetical protein